MKLNLNLLAIFCCIFLFSCNSESDDKKHAAYIDSIKSIADPKLRINFDKGSKYYDSAYRAYPNLKEHDVFKKEFLMASVKLLTYDSPDSALMFINSAIDHLDQNKYQIDLMRAYMLKANILMAQENYGEAFNYFFLAKTISEKEKADYKQRAWLSVSLANILFNQKKYNEAIKYYTNAYQLYSKIETNKITERHVPLQQNLNNIALSYERINKIDSAEKWYKKAIKLIDDANFPNDEKILTRFKSIVLGNLGFVYYKKGEYALAEKTLKQSLALNKYEKEDEFFTKIKLATLYAKQNRNTEIESLIKQVETDKRFNRKSFHEGRKRLYELAYNHFERVDNLTRAYGYYKRFHYIKDSLDIASSLLANKDINREFLKLSQKVEIESLKKKHELKSLYLVLTVSLTFLSLLSIFLILRNMKINKVHIKKLTILNAKISGHNEMMQKTLEALEQSQEENTRIMQVVAHDMRTPIAGVIGLTSLMLEEGDLNEEQREIITMINTSGGDTLNFINDLLQVQYGKSNLIKEPVALHTLLKYCITLLDSKAKEKQQQIKIISTPITLKINREKIWRVMSNLISNAIKFSAKGTEINVIMEEKPSSALIKIKDNGIGIPANIADKLFTMNAEIQRDGTSGEKSFGLGLSICKQIVEAHNGSIWFESIPGNGTTFYVELPLTEN
ncbi:tetratricopeptide repeat-containing sensor histidine kinase [Pedobacter cryotolerans]|uniref:histidine kinase n=1 Tax=Pedobacter cryotolerans TaxID=2571270 RepID=A0A4U1C8B8_9SPHI|nr:ATP-binding protein [Pedobacter cryotolerans]TKC02556.1 tetratricopeptide repeat protein [Pedobacter cryotolerans]